MESDILKKLEEQEAVLKALQESVRKTERYLMVMMWIGVATVLAPILGLLFIIPWFLSAYGSALEGLL